MTNAPPPETSYASRLFGKGIAGVEELDRSSSGSNHPWVSARERGGRRHVVEVQQEIGIDWTEALAAAAECPVVLDPS
jgi:hypothetical protein